MQLRVLRSFLFTIIIVLFSTQLAYSQNAVMGTVFDKTDRTPLPHVMIFVNDDPNPELTDMNGNFDIKVKGDSCKLKFHYNVYHEVEEVVYFTAKQKVVKILVGMIQEAQLVEGIEITAKKIDNDPITATSSIMKISPKSGENMNVTAAPEMLNKVGGVAVIDNEPQIRGGSGFSSGMGSRVLILLDNMPLLRPDAGRPMWSFIPMEGVKEIEVYKGAASVVYGSSALTGAINVLTNYPSLKPSTKITLHAGIYDSPANSYKKSWEDVPPLKWGISFMHSRIIKKNFDLVLGAEYFSDQGYIGPEYPVSQAKSNEGQFENRARLNFGTRYRFEKVKGLNISLNGNFMYSENGQSFFWYDSDTNMYRSYKGSLSVFKDFSFYVDPTISYAASDGSYYTLRNRVTYSNNKEKTGLQDASSIMVYDEFQYTKTFKKIGLSLCTGIMNNYSSSYGVVFNGDNNSTEPARMSADNFAPYAQLEWKTLKNKNLTIVFGVRHEFYLINNELYYKTIHRGGINYQIPASYTSFRASFGQGFRYPSIGEKYISVMIGKYGFYPNTQLVPEDSWNAELGIAQPFRVKAFKGIFDVAGYYQHYNNFIEFAFGTWGNHGNFLEDMGFKYFNTGKAAISGVDISLMGEGNLSPNVFFRFTASYTYSHPVTKSKESDKNYYLQDSINNYYNTSSDPSQRILKYRIQHTAKLDLEFTFWKKLSLNVGAAYYSAMKNVDKMFFDFDAQNENLGYAQQTLVNSMGDLPFEGYANYVEKHKAGSFILDLGISYNILKDLKLSFVVKNVLNNEYALRPMHVEAPRNFNVQISYGL